MRRVDDVLVNLVGDDVGVVLFRERRDEFKLLAREHLAAGVGRVAQDHRLGVLAERILEDSRVKMEIRRHERILGDDDEPVEIFPDQKNILFRIGGTTLITRLIEGEFLNYRAAIPNDFEHVVSIDPHELITSIERVSLIVSEKLKNPVRFHFDGNYVQLSCVTAIGKSYDECPIDGSIEDLEIGFNNRYMLDALRAAGTEKVLLQLKGALNPIVISPTEGDKFTYLVLPVRLRAND